MARTAALGKSAMNANQTVNRIREITNLLYDAYGEDIHPREQLNMIQRVLNKYKETEKWSDCGVNGILEKAI
jgi:20S proteasome alpha/beta subunit